MGAGLLATSVATTAAGFGWQASGGASIFGWTIVHSVWQAGLVACALVLVLRFVPGVMPRLRTALASGGLVLVAGPVSVASTAVSSWAVMERDIAVREQATAPDEMGPAGEKIADEVY